MFAGLGALAALTYAGCSSDSPKTPPPAPPAPQVVVAQVVEKTIPIYADYVGQTQAVNTVEIRSQVTGFLKSLAFPEGSLVEAGQLLFTIDPRPFEAAVRQAQGVLGQNLAALEIAQENVKRYRPLAQLHAISQEQLDTAIAAEKQAQANVDAARAQVANAQLNLGFTRITAPIAGQIGPAQVKIGALVQSGSTLLDTIYSIDPIYVNFSVSQGTYLEYASKFAPPPQSHGAPVTLKLAADTPYPYSGRIDMVGPNVNTATGVLSLRAVFPNSQRLLKPGLFVSVRMLLGERKNALLVPKPAVQELQGTQSVDVVGAGNKVEFRKVAVEGSYEQYVVVTSGLREGEQVIVEGQQQVRPGMQVQPVQAAQAGG